MKKILLALLVLGTVLYLYQLPSKAPGVLTESDSSPSLTEDLSYERLETPLPVFRPTGSTPTNTAKAIHTPDDLGDEEVVTKRTEEFNHEAPDDKIETAKKLLDAGNPDEAIALLEQLLDEKPNSQEYKEAIGYAYVGVGRIDDAEVLFSQLLADNPENPEYHFGLAMVRRAQGDVDEAITLLTETITLDPTDTEAKSELADLYTFDKRGSPQESIQMYTEALEKNPDNNIELMNGLAAAHANAGEVETATKIWEGLIATEPDNSTLLSNLCEAYVSSGNAQEGTALCERAIEKDTQNSEAYYMLGIQAQNNGDYEEAQELLQRALAIEPDNPDYQSALDKSEQ